MFAFNEEGYANGVYQNSNSEPTYSYYRRDHLGNNREVWRAAYTIGSTNYAATTTQRIQYYPSGLPWGGEATGIGPGAQPYKFNGCEFIEEHGYDVTDLGNRVIHNARGSFDTMDRLAGKFPWQSPYVHAGNNLVNYVDVNGDSVMIFVNGTYFGTFDDGKTEIIGYNQNFDEDGNMNGGFHFSFNDLDLDQNELISGNMTLNFVSNEYIDNIMNQSGVKEKNAINRWSYALNESNRGELDYSKYLNSNQLYVINGTGYNRMDAGNYMWGYAMGLMGYTEITARAGAHVFAFMYGKQTNGEESYHPNMFMRFIENRSWLGDSAADQRAIKNGINDSGSYWKNKKRTLLNIK